MSAADITDARIDDVLAVWFGPPDEAPAARQRRWFVADPAFDDELRRRFVDVIGAAGRGELSDWQATARGSLALVIVLDQLSRNVFRGTALAFSQDASALAVARASVAAGQDRELTYGERAILLMPFMHAEDRDTQRESVAAFEALHAEAVAAAAPAGEVAALAGAADFARRHAAVIERFGRYPHRNAMLERTSTGDEAEYLSQPGAGF